LINEILDGGAKEQKVQLVRQSRAGTVRQGQEGQGQTGGPLRQWSPRLCLSVRVEL